MKKSRTNYLAAVAIGATILLFMPSAQAFTDSEINQIFKKFDTNGDGKVTREEYEINKVEIIYRRVPTNPIEGVTFEQTRVSRRFFDAADKNHDGKLSPQEIFDALPFEGVAGTGRDYFESADLKRFLESIDR